MKRFNPNRLIGSNRKLVKAPNMVRAMKRGMNQGMVQAMVLAMTQAIVRAMVRSMETAIAVDKRP
jgi:hypothetical protein